LRFLIFKKFLSATATDTAQTNSSKGGGAKAKDAQSKASTHADTKNHSEKADHSKKGKQ
jgi:hypothetical protein